MLELPVYALLLTLPDRWTEAHRLPSADATQAAVATRDHVYAVSNTRVVRHDRLTGRAMATSFGAPARHLNSGVIHRGSMLLAHSNYPETPERSQVYRLDLATMELSVHRELGNPGGSLTWILPAEGAGWWCFFARYGADNAGSRLVRYTSDWRELRRYRLPEEVLERLGAHSLSGAVLRDGVFWATGHDDPIAFALRVPLAGDTLEYLGDAAVPFTGQGIADDPATPGGLVGIDRPKRQVVFAFPGFDTPFPLERAAADERRRSERLLQKSLDAEALFTITGGLKPISEGFWEGEIPADADTSREIERVRRAVSLWRDGERLTAGVLVFARAYDGKRYATAWVADRRAVRRAIERHPEVFAPLGIAPWTDPAEALRRADAGTDGLRWRALGHLFGYPDHAVDFFADAGIEGRRTGELVPRDFVNLPTFASDKGRFVYAVPKGAAPTLADAVLKARAAESLATYRELRAKFVGPGKPGVAELARRVSR